jgi:hypothetical protein
VQITFPCLFNHLFLCRERESGQAGLFPHISTLCVAAADQPQSMGAYCDKLRQSSSSSSKPADDWDYVLELVRQRQVRLFYEETRPEVILNQDRLRVLALVSFEYLSCPNFDPVVDGERHAVECMTRDRSKTVLYHVSNEGRFMITFRSATEPDRLFTSFVM